MADTKRGRLATKALVKDERAMVYELDSNDAEVDVFIANKCSGPAQVSVSIMDGVDYLGCLYGGLQKVVEEDSFPFTIEYQKGGTGETVTGLLLTWKEGGVISTTAVISDDDSLLVESTQETAGTETVEEVQHIDIATEDMAAGDVYTLTFGEDSITGEALVSESTAVSDLVLALQGATGYGDMPFTVAANSTTGLALTWKAVEVVDGVAVLTEADETEYTGVVETEGGVPGIEIQSIILADSDVVLGNEVTLTHNDNEAVTTGPVSLDDMSIDASDYLFYFREVAQGDFLRIKDISMGDGEVIIAKSTRTGVAIRVSGTEQELIAE
jgi:hypothetical protein